MSDLKIKGTIRKIFDTVQVTDKFCKREFVLETGDKYLEFIKFQVVQDKCELLDKFREGDEINVFFNLKGKPYTNKDGVTSYFTNLDAWKLEGESKQPEQPKAKPTPTPKITTPPEESEMIGVSLESLGDEDEDDLPF